VPSLAITVRQGFGAGIGWEQTHTVALEGPQSSAAGELSGGPISTLLVATKAFDVASAISGVLPRLSSERYSEGRCFLASCLAILEKAVEREW
jgi:hypothetical protein